MARRAGARLTDARAAILPGMSTGRRHGARNGAERESRHRRRPLRPHCALRRRLRLPLRRLHLRAQRPHRHRLPAGGGCVGLAPAAALAAVGVVPRGARGVRALRGLDGPLGPLVVRARPQLDGVRPDRSLSGRDGHRRIHAGRAASAACRRDRLPRRQRGGRRVRAARQGAARRGDARAHVRAAGQPRRVLERPRHDDGVRARRRARARRATVPCTPSGGCWPRPPACR